MGKDEIRTAPAVPCAHEQRDEDDDDRGGGPDDAELVDVVEIARAKGVDEEAHQHDGPEHEDGLVGIWGEVGVP